MTTVQDIVDRAMFITKDSDAVRFTLPEMVTWVRDAVDQIATMHPRVAAKYLTIALQEGAHQDLAEIDPTARWIRLHQVMNNVDASNKPVGFQVRQVSRSALYYSLAKWGAASAKSGVREFSMDEREALAFDVYPPVEAGTKVLILASVKPEPIEDEDSVFPLPDGYEIPATDYVLYRLFSKDANDPTYMSRASGHLQAFNLAMGVETKDAAA